MQQSKEGIHFFENRIVLHLIAWILSFLLFFISFSGMMDMGMSLLTTLTIFIPAAGAIYAHFYFIERFLYRRKYIIYGLLTFLCVAVAGQISNYVFERVLYKEEPNTKIAGVIIISIFIVASTGLRYFYNGVKQRLEKKELEAKQVRTELNVLKSQINPHFLFNSLNNIYGLTMDQPEKVGETILKLSSLMRYILDSSKRSKVKLSEEYQFLKNYIEMEELRLGEKCKIQFSTQGNFNHKEIAPMLLIPFVENSFKHGSFKTIGESYIHMKLAADQEWTSFSIKNSINNNDEGQVAISTETGIENTKKRLAILYPNKHKLDIAKTDQYFLVNLDIEI
jgi:LytS/YehU family sensor histidine kinase